MTSADILAALHEAIQPLAPYGPVKIYFCHAEFTGIFQRYVTKSEPPLEFDVFGDERKGFEVYLRKVGRQPILESLPRGEVQVAMVLPEEIFIPGDEFLKDYKRAGDKAHANYGLYTQICQELKPRSILEIGVRAGYSAFAMLQGAPFGTPYVGFDLEQEAFDTQASFGGIKYYTASAETMLQSYFPASSITIHYRDTQLLDELPGQYDLISVDGAHSHENAVHDLELCARHAKCLIVDDVSFIAPVGSAVEEFLANHPEMSATFYDTWRGHVLIDTRKV